MKLRKLYPFVPILLMAALLAACGGNDAGGGSQAAGAAVKPKSETYFIFDTVVSVRIYDERAGAEQFEAVDATLHRIDREMNRQLEGSEIDHVNRQAGIEPVRVSPETFLVVQKAVDYAAASGGKFDPTVGPLVDLWGIGSEGAHVPAKDEIEQTLPLIDYRQVELNEAESTIFLKQPGMSLDLGAIAKGYAADVIAADLKAAGFQSAIIDLGGNVLAMGEKPGAANWIVGIQDPSEQRGSHIGTVAVTDKTIVTSGVYERYFIENGQHYHHILDPDTGYPTNNDLLSVTIVTGESAHADAMSTSVFALGLTEGMRYVEGRGDADAIFITHDRDVYVTSGLKDVFKLTDDAYRIAELN